MLNSSLGSNQKVNTLFLKGVRFITPELRNLQHKLAAIYI